MPVRLGAVLLCLGTLLAGDRRVVLGNPEVSAGYWHTTGPGWPGLTGWYPIASFGNPSWTAALFAPGFYRGFAYAPNFGQVKLQPRAGAAVFLDGAYAGSASELKEMWLEPGVYTLEVRAPDGSSYEKRIYVLSNRTVKVDPVLEKKESR